MNIKYRVGNKVVIKNYVHDRSEHYNFVPEMDRYIGCIATVVSNYNDRIRLDIDGQRFAWHPAWLGLPKGRVDIYEY